ncbi:hypothetical protein B0H13DRAFT_1883506 [Mycena leptocephala]|nr:hypothetical protein B0H13DRAFT_1883506 [Mycena leptocephala]
MYGHQFLEKFQNKQRFYSSISARENGSLPPPGTSTALGSLYIADTAAYLVRDQTGFKGCAGLTFQYMYSGGKKHSRATVTAGMFDRNRLQFIPLARNGYSRPINSEHNGTWEQEEKATTASYRELNPVQNFEAAETRRDLQVEKQAVPKSIEPQFSVAERVPMEEFTARRDTAKQREENLTEGQLNHATSVLLFVLSRELLRRGHGLHIGRRGQHEGHSLRKRIDGSEVAGGAWRLRLDIIRKVSESALGRGGAMDAARKVYDVAQEWTQVCLVQYVVNTPGALPLSNPGNE